MAARGQVPQVTPCSISSSEPRSPGMGGPSKESGQSQGSCL